MLNEEDGVNVELHSRNCQRSFAVANNHDTVVVFTDTKTGFVICGTAMAPCTGTEENHSYQDNSVVVIQIFASIFGLDHVPCYCVTDHKEAGW